jgi:hypothetical protein
MAECEVEEDIAICPLCYCPFNPTVEDCPECNPFAVQEGNTLPEADHANAAVHSNWLGRLQRSVSNLVTRSFFRSNK